MAPGLRLSVPQEPLLVMILLLALRSIKRSDWTHLSALFNHPIAIAAAGSLAWTIVAAGLSTQPVISLKVLMVRSLQAVVFFGGGVVFLSTIDAARKLAIVGALGLAPIALWATARAQLLDGWQAVHASATPFFPNRLELTVVAIFWLCALLGSHRDKHRPWSWLVALPLASAVVVLRGRAAIVGGVLGLASWFVARQKKEPAVVVLVAMLAVIVVGAVATDLWVWRESSNDPLRAATVLEPAWQLVSATALAADESLLERLNRWRCALRMAADRPLGGFGPGTFETAYGPYQRSGDWTRWSTDKGDLGDTHSEPLGRLAEEGIPGVALQFLMLLMMVVSGLRATRIARDPSVAEAAAAWTGAVVGVAGASLFVGISELPGTGLTIWLAAAALLRLEQMSRQESGIDPEGVPCESRNSASGRTA